MLSLVTTRTSSAGGHFQGGPQPGDAAADDQDVGEQVRRLLGIELHQVAVWHLCWVRDWGSGIGDLSPFAPRKEHPFAERKATFRSWLLLLARPRGELPQGVAEFWGRLGAAGAQRVVGAVGVGADQLGGAGQDAGAPLQVGVGLGDFLLVADPVVVFLGSLDEVFPVVAGPAELLEHVGRDAVFQLVKLQLAAAVAGSSEVAGLEVILDAVAASDVTGLLAALRLALGLALLGVPFALC